YGTRAGALAVSAGLASRLRRLDGAGLVARPRRPFRGCASHGPGPDASCGGRRPWSARRDRDARAGAQRSVHTAADVPRHAAADVPLEHGHAAAAASARCSLSKRWLHAAARHAPYDATTGLRHVDAAARHAHARLRTARAAGYWRSLRSAEQ